LSTFVKPIQFGKLVLPNNVFYSPLAGCSDFPFRQMVAKYKPGLVFCEMVKMDALVRNDACTFRMLDFNTSMHPIGAQLCGNNLEIVAEAAKILEDMGFDVIDLNCGCPVDKVTKDGGGSGLLKTPERIGDLLHAIISAVKVPVTVKIRAGWDDQSINGPQITEIAEAAGAVAIAVHGRTRKQGYRGPADWSLIKDCVDVAKTIKVIGNGDVMCGESAQRMFMETGCDVVLASRGTMGAPWIAEQIMDYDSGKPVHERSFEESRQALIQHFRYILDYFPERKALLDIRRVGCWYLKKSARTREFRGAISKVQSLEEAFDLLENFPSDSGLPTGV
jgi:tRNA-dihydrouridine synthase B